MDVFVTASATGEEVEVKVGETATCRDLCDAVVARFKDAGAAWCQALASGEGAALWIDGSYTAGDDCTPVAATGLAAGSTVSVDYDYPGALARVKEMTSAGQFPTLPGWATGNADVVLSALARLGPQCLAEASQELMDDTGFMLKAVTADGRSFAHALPGAAGSKEVALVALRCAGTLLRYADTELCNDAEVVAAAVRGDPESFMYASPELRADASFVLPLASRRATCALVRHSELRKDAVFIRAVLADGAPWVFRHVDFPLQTDGSFAAGCVAVCPRVMEFVPASVLVNRVFLKSVLETRPEGFKHLANSTTRVALELVLRAAGDLPAFETLTDVLLRRFSSNRSIVALITCYRDRSRTVSASLAANTSQHSPS